MCADTGLCASKSRQSLRGNCVYGCFGFEVESMGNAMDRGLMGRRSGVWATLMVREDLGRTHWVAFMTIVGDQV